MLLSDEIISNSKWVADMQLSDRIGRRLKLQDLHVLMTVVQAGTMGKAAQHLNTTQPNISRAIAELEHAFGVRLLDRHRQGIAPTEYGRALLVRARRVHAEMQRARTEIAALVEKDSVRNAAIFGMLTHERRVRAFVALTEQHHMRRLPKASALRSRP